MYKIQPEMRWSGLSVGIMATATVETMVFHKYCVLYMNLAARRDKFLTDKVPTICSRVITTINKLNGRTNQDSVES